MSKSQIRYDLLMHDAMRGVIKAILTDVAKDGLPGDHHFYIVFDTTADGVQISEKIRAQYPQEMTIVLQHQFWGLQVSGKKFEVQLSFNGQVEHIVVPFEAIKGFVDPSVSYGFHIGGNDSKKAPHHLNMLVPTEGLDLSADPTEPVRRDDADSGDDEAAKSSDAEKPAEKGSAEIVELDQFRKK